MAKSSLVSIVDDDRFVRESLKRLMKSLGFAVEVFESGADFLESPRLDETACLIADVQMPGMSGVELHARLHKDGRKIPTILITAYPDDGVRARVLEEGVRGYLIKPFRDRELIAHVQSALDGQISGK